MHVKDFEIFKNIPTLKTERLILRKISKNDLDDIFEYSSDPEISRFLLWSAHENKRVTKFILHYPLFARAPSVCSAASSLLEGAINIPTSHKPSLPQWGKVDLPQGKDG